MISKGVFKVRVLQKHDQGDHGHTFFFRQIDQSQESNEEEIRHQLLLTNMCLQTGYILRIISFNEHKEGEEPDHECKYLQMACGIHSSVIQSDTCKWPNTTPGIAVIEVA